MNESLSQSIYVRLLEYPIVSIGRVFIDSFIDMLIIFFYQTKSKLVGMKKM